MLVSCYAIARVFRPTILLCSQKLSDECMTYVKRLMREAARDYRMDARLSKECDDDVSMLILRRSGVK